MKMIVRGAKGAEVISRGRSPRNVFKISGDPARVADLRRPLQGRYRVGEVPGASPPAIDLGAFGAADDYFHRSLASARSFIPFPTDSNGRALLRSRRSSLHAILRS